MNFELLGLRIHLDITFFAMLGILLYLGVSSRFWWMLSAMLLHETGHLLAALLTGLRMRSFSFSCIGICLVREQGAAVSRKREGMVLFGGPLINLCCFVLLWSMGKEIPGAIHLLLGCFQLLPIGALDGGCILRLLLERYLPAEKAEWTEILIGIAVLIPLFRFGIRLFWGEEHNFTLLLCCVFLLLTILLEKVKKI